MADKKAMSRALGAAFLNHQVEQLEKSAASGNWRSRAQPTTQPKRLQQPEPTRKKASATAASGGGRRSMDDEKDADVVVVDASVLVHALHQVRRWCRDGREEVVIVPLEALNTLDLLKKGNSALAQRARAASRILEAQVGTNPRIRVQQDDAFVPWDAIPWAPTPPPSSTTPTAADDASPEWVRRTVCCARWELDAAAPSGPPDSAAPTAPPTRAPGPAPTVILAVLAPNAPGLSTADGGPLSKHEPRATGALVAHWAARAGLVVRGVAPSTAPPPAAAAPNAHTTHANNNNNNNATPPDSPRRPRSSTATSTKRERPHPHGGKHMSGSLGKSSGSLVERPATVLAMPSTIRVLARGERLDGVV
ncbi:hypothetical protein B0H12DRAFT_538509 [Mycena haematopus]|nr:hypothetical protein B0H12DRAFT_538509 [Mycena haematopus]